MEIQPKLESSWLQVLEKEFKKEYFQIIKKTLVDDIQAHKILYPPMPLIFNSFNITAFDDVKVVILGQDPYHGPNQAHGLSFSVQDGVLFPPSLKNIFKEIKEDIGKEIPASGNLERWAKEGVLLLNAILTVRAGEPASHAKIGWEQFTDAVIKTISDKKEGVVFLLWGNFAKSKKTLIDINKHFVLEASHPSPLGAHKGFFGCKHFSKTNEILKKLGKKEIEW
ncbi:uracil-DNA glycosylase [Candidatus Gracilibacteria bacterium]|nr:uracil-DNA glycosylase [Candidatus Gracilibacteria bacterium]NUJ99045.1 uracil-DNA glycosylase [Candidatus Gracilibacteria bacterium]